jgi:hypothetical protein
LAYHTAKLDTSIQVNVINHVNEKDARLIWKSITNHFASSKASNCARVFKELLRLQFDVNNILGFITELKTTLARFHEIGIEIANDIVTYLIVNKLPSSLENLAKRITQLDETVTPETAMELLRTYNNDRSMKSGNSGTWSNPIALLTVFTDTADTRCKKGAHNTAAPNHDQAHCWKLFPKKCLPHYQNQGKKEKTKSTVSTFLSSISKHSSQFILDSGSLAHMVSSRELVHTLELKDLGTVRTSSSADSLRIQGVRSILLKNKFGEISLNQVLFIPDLVVNLLSV